MKDESEKNRRDRSSDAPVTWTLYDQNINLTPDEQLVLWQALQAPAKLTSAQKRLAAMMTRL